jgi:hypothetical protein
MITIDINRIIQKDSGVVSGQVSDGYHTFDELYDHRIELFLTMCFMFIQGKPSWDKRGVWMSRKHSDSTEFDGWFVMGIGCKDGDQITYHLPISRWDEAAKFAAVLDKAPEWDGHTSADVLVRLRRMLQ